MFLLLIHLNVHRKEILPRDLEVAFIRRYVSMKAHVNTYIKLPNTENSDYDEQVKKFWANLLGDLRDVVGDPSLNWSDITVDCNSIHAIIKSNFLLPQEIVSIIDMNWILKNNNTCVENVEKSMNGKGNLPETGSIFASMVELIHLTDIRCGGLPAEAFFAVQKSFGGLLINSGRITDYAHSSGTIKSNGKVFTFDLSDCSSALQLKVIEAMSEKERFGGLKVTFLEATSKQSPIAINIKLIH